MTKSNAAPALDEPTEPLPEGPGLDVALADITLPPAHLVDELDNSEAGGEAEAPASVEVATLDFCGDELPFVTHPLKYPFRLHGERIDSVTVRQLTTAQMGELVRRASREKRGVDLYDAYAVMAGLPASVLRALPAVDGQPITDAAYDFLPPLLRPESG